MEPKIFSKEWMKKHWIEIIALVVAAIGAYVLVFRKSSPTSAQISYPPPAAGTGQSAGDTSGPDMQPITDAITQLGQQEQQLQQQMASMTSQDAASQQTYAQELAQVQQQMQAALAAQAQQFQQQQQQQQQQPSGGGSDVAAQLAAQQQQFQQQLSAQEAASAAALQSQLAQANAAWNRIGATAPPAGPPTPPPVISNPSSFFPPAIPSAQQQLSNLGSGAWQAPPTISASEWIGNTGLMNWGPSNGGQPSASNSEIPSPSALAAPFQNLPPITQTFDYQPSQPTIYQAPPPSTEGGQVGMWAGGGGPTDIGTIIRTRLRPVLGR